MKSVFYIAIAILTLCGCKGKPLSEAELPVEHLQARPLLAEDYVLGNGRMIDVNNRFIVVQDTKTEYFFHLFDIQTRKPLCTFGKSGQGPDEFLFPTHLNCDTDSSFYFMDANKRVYYRCVYSYERDTVAVYPVFKSPEVLHLDVVPLQDNLFLSGGYYHDARYQLIDSLGNVLDSYTEFPARDDVEKELNKHILTQVYFTWLATYPAKDKFVAVTHNAKILSLFQIKNGRIELIKEIVEGYPEYRYAKGDVTYRGILPKNRLGFLDVTADDKHIYALYSGKSLQEDGNKAFYGDMIYVYDWEGNMQRKLQIDRFSSGIRLAKDGSRLYAVVLNPDIQIVEYMLTEE